MKRLELGHKTYHLKYFVFYFSTGVVVFLAGLFGLGLGRGYFSGVYDPLKVWTLVLNMIGMYLSGRKNKVVSFVGGAFVMLGFMLAGLFISCIVYLAVSRY